MGYNVIRPYWSDIDSPLTAKSGRRYLPGNNPISPYCPYCPYLIIINRE